MLLEKEMIFFSFDTSSSSMLSQVRGVNAWTR